MFHHCSVYLLQQAEKKLKIILKVKIVSMSMITSMRYACKMDSSPGLTDKIHTKPGLEESIALMG